MHKSTTYYAVRTCVRFAFWSSIAAGFAIAVIKVSEIGDKPSCSASLNVDFTWNPKNPNIKAGDVNLSECSHPDYVVLLNTGTWDWVG